MTGSTVTRLALALLLMLSVPTTAAPASADPSCISVGWEQMDASCQWTFAEYQGSSSSGDGRTWVVAIQCANGGICNDNVECAENGQDGYIHDVYLDGVDVGDVCVPDNAVQQVDLVQLIIREFKRIGWPYSELVVQPRGGRTLVNFDTNFYTPDHQAIDKGVTLAGQAITIRAVPVSYDWYFGDDTSTTTTSPGSPHPNLEITHQYERTGDVVVRLDTTYAGEYRIGDGEWTAIGETLTVEGEDQDLEIVEALPQLVLE